MAGYWRRDGAAGASTGGREKLGAKPKGSERGRDEAAEEVRDTEARYACDYAARIASADRDISTAGRIVSISATSARVEVMYPRRGPSTIFLFDLVNGEIYECEVTWRTDLVIGVRFLDVLGPGRRRRWRAGEDVPIRKSDHRVIQLDEPPKEKLLPGPPPGRLFLGVEKEPSPDATPPTSNGSA
jgi:hypothetical protein